MRLSIPMLAFALLTAGFLWPTEEAVSGLGLHLVTLWMLLGMLHELQCWWNTDEAGSHEAGSQWPKFDWMDLGVLLLAIGHVISTVVVFQVEGDGRAAINLTFEWIGLLVAWRIFRSLFQDRQVAAQAIAVVIALCVGLSCFGIWQHHVFYAEQQQWYRNLRSELDQALAANTGSQMSRASEITREFQEHDIPMHGPSRIAWENRLLSSSEPFATFSLANTLAGILATGLVLLIGQASSTVGDPQETTRLKSSRLSQALLLIQICLIAYCLILTKSRSAWLGCCVGMGILLIRRIRVSAIQNLFRWLVAGSLIAATAIGIGVAVGGLDKEVILESPRSLQFRLLYWTGTLRMLQHQPFSGAGPGNFRQAYLQYKADETSEEIRDPHNFVLDAWSSSGLIGLSGLLLIIGGTGWRLIKRPPPSGVIEANAEQKTMTALRRRPLRIAVWGMSGGFLLHLAWTWFNGSDEWTSQPIRLLLLAGVSLMISRGKSSFRLVDATTCIAAATAMMVNLLAAGGFEMPAVMITLLLVLSASIAVAPISGTSPGRQSFVRYRCLISAAVCLALFVLVSKTGLFPVTTAENYVQNGNSMLNNAQFPARAIDQFLQARQADPQSPIPRQRIAEVLSYRLSEAAALRAAETGSAGTISSSGNTDEEIQRLAENALQACEDLLEADRRNSFSYRLRAEVRWNAGLVYDDQELRKLAIQDLQMASNLYPSSVDALYRLAERLDSAGVENVDAAKAAAAEVLQMETMNRSWGHADRFLTEEQLATMNRIVNESI